MFLILRQKFQATLRLFQMDKDTAVIPIMLSHNLDETIIFYRNLGFAFEDLRPHNQYLIATFEDIEIHFQSNENLDIFTNNSMCYIRMKNAKLLFNKWQEIGLPRNGIPRMDNMSLKPWGMYEFAIIDPSGNLIRIGKPAK